LDIDRGFKAVSRTLENKKIVMYSIISKLNSTFGTIGNDTADKITAKVGEVVSTTQAFALA